MWVQHALKLPCTRYAQTWYLSWPLRALESRPEFSAIAIVIGLAAGVPQRVFLRIFSGPKALFFLPSYTLQHFCWGAGTVGRFRRTFPVPQNSFCMGFFKNGLTAIQAVPAGDANRGTWSFFFPGGGDFCFLLFPTLVEYIILNIIKNIFFFGFLNFNNYINYNSRK